MRLMNKNTNLTPVEKETYTQPLLTRHEALHSLTGKSGEKTSDIN